MPSSWQLRGRSIHAFEEPVDQASSVQIWGPWRPSRLASADLMKALMMRMRVRHLLGRGLVGGRRAARGGLRQFLEALFKVDIVNLEDCRSASPISAVSPEFRPIVASDFTSSMGRSCQKEGETVGVYRRARIGEGVIRLMARGVFNAGG